MEPDRPRIWPETAQIIDFRPDPGSIRLPPAPSKARQGGVVLILVSQPIRGAKSAATNPYLRSEEVPSKQKGHGPGRAPVRHNMPKPYEFIGFGDMYAPKPYESIGFGDI